MVDEFERKIMKVLEDHISPMVVPEAYGKIMDNVVKTGSGQYDHNLTFYFDIKPWIYDVQTNDEPESLANTYRENIEKTYLDSMVARRTPDLKFVKGEAEGSFGFRWVKE